MNKAINYEMFSGQRLYGKPQSAATLQNHTEREAKKFAREHSLYWRDRFVFLCVEGKAEPVACWKAGKKVAL